MNKQFTFRSSNIERSEAQDKGGTGAVTFKDRGGGAYHVVVRDGPNTRHENVSLDFGYALC